MKIYECKNKCLVTDDPRKYNWVCNRCGQNLVCKGNSTPERVRQEISDRHQEHLGEIPKKIENYYTKRRKEQFEKEEQAFNHYYKKWKR